MLSFSSVAEAFRPDPPSPVGVNFFLIERNSPQAKMMNTKRILDEEKLKDFVSDFNKHFEDLAKGIRMMPRK